MAEIAEMLTNEDVLAEVLGRGLTMPVRLVEPIFTGTVEDFYSWLLVDDFRRERGIAIDFSLDAGEEGEAWLPMPTEFGRPLMCIRRELYEAGDSVIEYEAWVDLKHPDNLAVPWHKVSSRQIAFFRRWEKRKAIIIHYKNADSANPAWFQIAIGAIFVAPEDWDKKWKPIIAATGRGLYERG